MNAKQYARRWASRTARARQEFRHSSTAIGKAAVKFCKEQMVRDIYSLPIPISSRTGEPAWRRTRKLINSETYELIDNGFGVRIFNPTVYAKRRHELGKPRYPKTDRPAHWRDELQRVFPPIAADIRRKTLRDILRGRP